MLDWMRLAVSAMPVSSERKPRPLLGLACRLPMFYAHPDGWVTLNAIQATDDITLFCRTRKGNKLSDPLTVAPRVVDLIRSLAEPPLPDESGRPKGIGLGYSRVVSVLSALTKDETVPGALVVQQPTMTELLGPDLTPGRPESKPEREEASGGNTGGDSKEATTARARPESP